MRLVALVLVSVLVASAAYAQDRTIDDVCLRAAEFELRRDGLVIISAQSFPELSPPRTEIIVGQPRPKTDGISDIVSLMIAADNAIEGRDPDADVHRLATVRCEFERAIPPIVLSDFNCSGFGYCPMMHDQQSRDRRLEELRVLLEREGF